MPSLFNTGVDAAGNPLPNGAADPHWTVVAGPGVPPVTLTNGFVLGTNTLDFVASDFGGIAGLNVTALNSSNFVVILPGARLWTGAGGNGLWSNPANWSNNVAPNPNDALIFPGPGGASVNDFPPATIFGAVQITGGAHTFGGAAFTAAGALSKFGPATLALNTNNPAYTGGTTVSAGTLLVNGATTNSALTLGGAGTSVSGTGHLGAFGNASGGGVVSPGGSGTGALLFSGSSTFDNTTTNRLQINGPTPGAAMMSGTRADSSKQLCFIHRPCSPR